MLHNRSCFPVADSSDSSTHSESPPALFRKYSDSSSDSAKYYDSSSDSEYPPAFLSRKYEVDSSSSDDDGAPTTSALGAGTRRHCKWHTVQRFAVTLDSASDIEEID